MHKGSAKYSLYSYTNKRVYRFSNQWKYEKTVYLLPSISICMHECCLDFSFLWFKLYTFIEYTPDE